MCTRRNNMALKVFQNQLKFNSIQFKSIQHKYATNVSVPNFKQPKTISKVTKFSITCGVTELWNNLINTEIKLLRTVSRLNKTRSRSGLKTHN